MEGNMHATGVKAILGYDIVDGVSVDEYDQWLWEVHYPDLLSNPYLDRVVLNSFVRPVTETSAGTSVGGDPKPFERIAELHFADHDAYENYLRWFEEHPIPVERSPAGRSSFRFYALCESVEASGDTD